MLTTIRLLKQQTHNLFKASHLPYLNRRYGLATISHCRNVLATNLIRRLDWLFFVYANIVIFTQTNTK